MTVELAPGARRVRITCRDLGGDGRTWTEDEIDVSGHPERFARGLVERFNGSLRPGERPREFVAVELDAGEGVLRHSWSKTNLVTIGRGRGPTHDTHRCRVCGATAKMVVLGEIVADRKRDRLGCPGPRLPLGETRRVRL